MVVFLLFHNSSNLIENLFAMILPLLIPPRPNPKVTNHTSIIEKRNKRKTTVDKLIVALPCNANVSICVIESSWCNLRLTIGPFDVNPGLDQE